MGSKTIQGELWGMQAKDWAQIQEKTVEQGYQYALDFLHLRSSDKLLDIGCGSGYFSHLAHLTGAEVTGLDASDALLAQASIRDNSINFLSGEMEELPFEDESFHVVCGFNSFQFAANVRNALTEAKRVLKSKGRLVVMIWGNQEDCEAAGCLKAIASLLPPTPPGAKGPFALSENNLLQTLLNELDLRIINNADVNSVWHYENLDTALKGLMSSGAVARVIQQVGFDQTLATATRAMQPFVKGNGHVVFHNKFRVIISEKS
uniref:class I SAM-dependent methyltransferase n=1 Tax=Pedobacter schmidteae TaxID=2201271 RepID=UPI000EB024EA|nr:class I SAM-dependent methyltransferase [Pedobacter schmidteae]